MKIPITKSQSEPQDLSDIVGFLSLDDGFAENIAQSMANGMEIMLRGRVVKCESLKLTHVWIEPVPCSPEQGESK